MLIIKTNISFLYNNSWLMHHKSCFYWDF